MKKVKMIVTSVVVLAIVGSAFAFNAKKIGTFCVTATANAGDFDCTTVLENSKRTTSTAGSPLTRRYFIAWDGASVLNCQNESTACTAGPVTFTAD